MNDRRSLGPLRLGLVGYGKIARTQHLPAIAAEASVELVAIADPGCAHEEVPSYRSIHDMLAAQPDIDAVLLCQPPQMRFDAARLALLAGRHVFLEKPPGTTVSEVQMLAALAKERGLTLFAAWHSREASAVQDAKRRLAGAQIDAIAICWKEDVHVWHPGQRWLWQAGGFGVFDPGINALSILTEVVPGPLRVVACDLLIPANCAAPIAASLALETAAGARIEAEFDFRQTGPQSWDIRIESDSSSMVLSDGGNRLSVNAELQAAEPEAEYARLYRRFVQLANEGRSEVDLAPLQLVADAFVKGRWITVDPFDP